ncbi:NmrA family transcriptional regulator [Streptomyces camponoticapitis]|uniref:NmrA family transcriptional regulator n=1 Tax=Streptomyces camponoticapitis TaxID=1616125 RepID=A0ABQ2EP04_9ACTN|nr:NAD(P)H-binding protein [Streptomyces camponoticapitis]GGK18651.1 NmrA family transcriptional regulator [Streptomyces camponoticapitis]
MTSSILVTGGTGTLGRLVTPLLRDTDHKVRVLSRHGRDAKDGVEYVTADLLKGEGIESAVDGAETVLHLAGAAKGDDEATRNLVRAASRVGVRHLVHISVIGADLMPLGYFRSKLGAERAVEDSGLPWTTLRAAQFHDLVLTVTRSMARLPVIPAPGGVRMQPVDARDVADRLVELTLGEPAGRVADLAGPEVYALAELSRGYLRARGNGRPTRRPALPFRVPGKVGRAYRAEDNLTLDGADLGTRTWEDFLAERVGGR